MKTKEIVFGLVLAVFLALVLSPFASPWPDGLERVAEDKGFLEKGEIAPLLTAPIPDYAWPSINEERLATSLAGVCGTLLIFVLGWGLAALMKRGRGATFLY